LVGRDASIAHYLTSNNAMLTRRRSREESMDQPIRYTVQFEGLDAADAARAAESLRRFLQEVDPTIQAKRVRTERETMDLGSVLEVILAARAITELTKGISNWLSRTHSSKVTVIGPDGKTIVENIGASEAAELAEKLQVRHGGR
jgi:hypothetical protein